MNKKILFSIIPMMLLLVVTTVGAQSCPSGTTPTPVETITVLSDGSSIQSTNNLEAGVAYLLEASGTYRFANWGDYGIADAEWAYRNDGYSNPNSYGWTLGEDIYPSILGLDVQVDGENVYWGDYNNTHNYVLSYAGNGNPVSFNIWDSNYGDNSGNLTVDISKCVISRSAEITSPEENEIIFTSTVDFEAFLVDDDEDFVDWAVREGTCAAGQGTVFGNVDGHSDVFDIDYDANTYTYYYSATADVSGWGPGMYCFVFNPREDAGETGIRLTREFEIVDNDLDDDGILNDDDRCPETTVDVPTKRLGTNRWIWDGSNWITEDPNGVGPEKIFTMVDTHGCSCIQILNTMGGKMTGHSKFGCSISVMEDFIASMQPVFVEAVDVYANDLSPTYSTISLESGVQYELEAVGTAFAGGKYTEDIEFDAKYSITHSKLGDTWTDAVTDYESYGPTLLDLFVDGGSVDWGAYNNEHTYYWTVTGAGVPLDLLVYDIYYPNNTGFITVNIYELP